MKKIIFYLLFLTSHLQIFAQVDADTLQTEADPVRQEFNELIENSNNYQEYKVVNYDALVGLRDNTYRHLQKLQDEIKAKEEAADEQDEEIASLEDELKATKANLQKINEEKDAIMFLGMPFSKGSYMALMWGVVAILLIALVVFIFRFKAANSTTRDARKKLEETEREFDTYRTKALEKEQRLGRMLQDERNKNSG